MLNILRASLKTGRVTTAYPKRSEPGAGRGRPEIDSARCDCTGACAGVCPSGAIGISKALSDSLSWQLDLSRCVFCGLCQEVCPNGAIRMTEHTELAVRDRDDLIISVSHPSRASNATVERPAPSMAALHRSSAGLTEVEDKGERLKARIRKLLKRSLHIRHMAAGSDNSCDWEIAHLLSPVYDIQRLGMDFVASPRHADLLMVTGAVTRHLEPALYATYEAMPFPRLVMAVGSEACGGGILQGSYAVAGGVDHCLPVDVYVPGDPPRPQALIQGLLIALDRL